MVTGKRVGDARWPRLTLVCAGTLVGLTLVELLLRWIGFSYELYPRTIEFGAPTPEEIESGFVADRDLFWVTNDYAAKLEAARAARPALIFMGDSCTEWGTYDELFRKLVADRNPGAVYSPASVGGPGWTSFQGLEQLRRDLLPLAPRVITVYFGWNDHWKHFGIPDNAVAQVNASLLFPAQRYSRLFQLITRAWVAVVGNREASSARVSQEDFRRNLTEMARLGAANDVAVVLLTAPTGLERGREPRYLERRHIDDLADVVPLHLRYAEIVREVAHREGAVLCDLARTFERLDPARRRSLFQRDGIHLRPAGDEIIAAQLYECFQETGLLKKILR